MMSKRWNRDTELAKSLLSALFGPPRDPRAQLQQTEWKCSKCRCPNFDTRKICRKCQAPRKSPSPAPAPAVGASTPAAAAPQAMSPKPAPWARAKAAATRASALEAALAAARATGGDDDFVKELETKLEMAKKASMDNRPMLDKLAGCRDAIGRREKKLEAAESALAKAMQDRDAILADLEEHRRHLKELEDEAEKATKATDMPVDTASDAEEELQGLQAQVEQLNSEMKKLREQNAFMRTAGRGLEVQVSECRAEKAEAQRQHSKLVALGSAEVKRRLEKCFNEHQQHLVAHRWEEAEQLAAMTQRLTAALREAGEREAQEPSNFDPNS